MNLGEKIYQHRRQLGISQEELAARLGVTRQAVSKWEVGTSLPELETVVALAKLFGVSTDYLLDAEGEPSQPEPSAARSEPFQSQPPRQDWLDRLPGFIGRAFRRFGWLAGVYVAAAGLAMALLGAIARTIAGKMFSGFSSALDGFSSIGSFSDPVFDAFQQRTDQMTQTMAQMNPVSILGGFMVAIGLVLAVGGVVLAIWLKKKFRDEA